MLQDLHQVFDFVTAQDGDLMLLIYKTDGEPNSPAFEVDVKEGSLWLYRNKNSSIKLNPVDKDIISNILKMQKLLVCEMKFPDDMENSEPEYIYEAAKL